MSVQLTPDAQLGFHRPYTQMVKRTLTVANPNDQPIMFKVKTTAPKQYCVRPNSGRVEPNERIEVQVLLQPMKEDPPMNAKCRDKFLVQSALIPKERDTLLMAELWSIVEKEEKDQIQEQKIRCVYLPANEDDGAAGSAQHVNGSTLAPPSRFAHDRPPSEDDTRFHTVRSSQGRELSNGDASVDSTSGDRSPPAALEQLADAAPAAPLAGVAAVGAGVASSLGLNSDTTTSSSAPAARDGSGSVLSNQTSSATSVGGEATLRKELAEARSEIERLKAQLGGGGAQLRQRTKGAGATGVTPSTTTAVIGHDVGVNPEAGVQLQTVAMLVFGTFVITWLFF